MLTPKPKRPLERAAPQNCADAASHPKLEHTVHLLREHFDAHGEGSRVMVFTTCRADPAHSALPPHRAHLPSARC